LGVRKKLSDCQGKASREKGKCTLNQAAGGGLLILKTWDETAKKLCGSISSKGKFRKRKNTKKLKQWEDNTDQKMFGGGGTLLTRVYKL